MAACCERPRLTSYCSPPPPHHPHAVLGERAPISTTTTLNSATELSVATRDRQDITCVTCWRKNMGWGKAEQAARDATSLPPSADTNKGISLRKACVLPSSKRAQAKATTTPSKITLPRGPKARHGRKALGTRAQHRATSTQGRRAGGRRTDRYVSRPCRALEQHAWRRFARFQVASAYRHAPKQQLTVAPRKTSRSSYRRTLLPRCAR